MSSYPSKQKLVELWRQEFPNIDLVYILRKLAPMAHVDDSPLGHMWMTRL